MQRIPVAGPWITAKEIEYVTDAVANGWYGKANEYHERFERTAAEYLHVRHAVALPSCTSALHLALAALGVGPGDEVIVPELTWIASAAPIQYVGAQPLFADVDERSWCLSPEAFERAITPRTRAVIVVHLYGGMADMESICRIAHRHGIAVIEDAAQAIGSTWQGRPAGSWGDVGTFSFHGSKTLTTGEGGMLVTSRDDLREKVLFLRDHGRPPGDTGFRNAAVAFKYKMSGLQAALGLAQLERVEELVARKREIFAWYERRLGHVPGLQLNFEPLGARNTYWMVTALWDSGCGPSKEQVVEALKARGIDTRPFFYPLSDLPAFAGTPAAEAARLRNVVSYGVGSRGINLPSALTLTESQVDLAARAFLDVLERRQPQAA